MLQLLKTLLDEFVDQLELTKNISVEREYNFSKDKNHIKVAIGIRRCGKSYFLFQHIRKLIAEGVDIQQILYLNLEDDRLLPLTSKQLAELLENFYTLYPNNHKRVAYIFLDEIQNVSNWQLVVRRFVDSKNAQLFLSGSSSKLLSKEIATSLRGRSISLELWPYSFNEFCNANAKQTMKSEHPLSKKQLDISRGILLKYFETGGFPAVQHLEKTDRRFVLQSYVETVIFRDIIERYGVTNSNILKLLIKNLLKNISTPFSINKFYNDLKSQSFKISKDSLYQYLNYIEDAYLLFMVPIFDESLRKGQKKPKKVYSIDIGLTLANTFNINNKWGCLLENLVYLDLRRQCAQVYYYMTENNNEVDFLIEKCDGSRELLQVVWDSRDPKTYAREHRALDEAKKETGLSGRIIDLNSYLSHGV